MRANYYDSIVNTFQENDWLIGPKATTTYDRSHIIDFKKVEQLRQDNCTENPDEFSVYATQYINTLEEYGWWVKVCPPDTDESDDEGEEPFTDLQDVILYVVNIYLYGFASNEPEVIDLTGDDDDNDNDNDYSGRNLLEEFQEQA